MAVGRRCSICGIDWPDDDDYETCPSCLDPDGTDRCRDIDPLGHAEALSLANHLAFDRFYEKWDESQPPERLDP